MELGPFTWGAGGKKLSPAEVAAMRQVSSALAARGGAPKDVGEGLNRIGEALLYRSNVDRSNAAESEGRAVVAQALAEAQAGGSADGYMSVLGNEWASPQQSAVAQALLNRMWGQQDRNEQRSYDAGLLADERAYNAPVRDAQLTGANLANETAAFQLDQMRNAPAPVAEAPTLKTIFDPETGREQTVQWTGQGWEPIGGVQAPKEPMVQVNTGSMGPKLGSLSTDYGYVLGPDGQPVIDPATGLPKAAPVPGSPAAREIEAAAAQQALGGEQNAMYADIVSEDIGRALNLLESDPTFTTGMFGQVMGNWKGSNADRLDQFLNTVRSNVAFDRLQKMREASPTGGALGSVTERELALLESTIGSLERSSPEDLTYNLKRVQEIYDRVMEKAAAYPNAAQFGFSGRAAQSTVDPNDIDALLELYK